MISKEMLQEFLQLGDAWEVEDIRYSKSTDMLSVSIKETNNFWTNQKCPRCKSRQVISKGYAKRRGWRHLDSFTAKTFIECALPRSRCCDCGQVFQANPAWQGRSKTFTKGFEAFALCLIRETTVKNASRVLCENDQRLWRMLFAYVGGAQGELSTVAISVLQREWNKSGQ